MLMQLMGIDVMCSAAPFPKVEFVDMYERQPLFADVDSFLRSQGFVFHRFVSLHGRPMKPLHLAANPLQPISQQLWADAVYVRDLWELQSHSRDQLLKLALILHEIYHSYDVVLHVLQKPLACAMFTRLL